MHIFKKPWYFFFFFFFFCKRMRRKWCMSRLFFLICHVGLSYTKTLWLQEFKLFTKVHYHQHHSNIKSCALSIYMNVHSKHYIRFIQFYLKETRLKWLMHLATSSIAAIQPITNTTTLISIYLSLYVYLNIMTMFDEAVQFYQGA